MLDFPANERQKHGMTALIFSLLNHPDTPPLSVRAVSVEVLSAGDKLSLIYRIENAADLTVPPRVNPDRADALWKTTCCEMFLENADATAYLEYNFSPSSRWAAYRFAAYRTGQRDLPLTDAPVVAGDWRGDSFVLQVQLAADAMLSGHRMGLSAVIEETDGSKSYWALAHAPGPPDFHNRDCFIATLPAPERP